MSNAEFAKCYPALATEVPLDPATVRSLQDLFKVLASDVRLRILQAVLSANELCVSDICEQVGMTAPAVSNHLQRLLDQGIVASNRQGQHVYYRVVDPCVGGLMDLGLCLLRERPARGAGSTTR